MRKLAAATLGLASTFVVGTAWADTLTYDTKLADPPGVYFGSGNSNSNFTVSTNNSVEIGLSAITRFLGPITPTGSPQNVYNVLTGDTTVPTKTGATWGVDFSINLNADGNGTLNLSQITTVFSLQDAVTGAHATGFDALSIGDNSVFPGPPATAVAAQNSEALSFSSIANAFGDGGFNRFADDTYIFTLSVFGPSVAGAGPILLASDTITVIAGRGASVPEPITLSLFGAGLAGAVAMKRRRKTKA